MVSEPRGFNDCYSRHKLLGFAMYLYNLAQNLSLYVISVTTVRRFICLIIHLDQSPDI